MQIYLINDSRPAKCLLPNIESALIILSHIFLHTNLVRIQNRLADGSPKVKEISSAVPLICPLLRLCKILSFLNVTIFSNRLKYFLNKFPHTHAGVFHMAKPYFTHEIYFTNPAMDLFY